MATTVTNSIGATGRDYSTIVSWVAAIPTDLTISRSGQTAQGGSTTTITLDSGASATDNYYTGLTVVNASSQERLITAYVGATKVATIGVLNGSSSTWTAPNNGDSYTINSVSYVGQCYNDATPAFSITAGISFSGNTTGASNTITLTTYPGQGAPDNPSVQSNAFIYNHSNGVAIESSTYNLTLCTISTANTTVSKLQFYTSNNAATCALITSSSALFDRCIFKKDYESYNAYIIVNYGGIVQNSLVQGGTGTLGMFVSNNSTTGKVYNTTFLNTTGSSGTGFSPNYTTVALENCLFIGWTYAISGYRATINMKANAFDQTQGNAEGGSSITFNHTVASNYSITVANEVTGPSTDMRLLNTGVCYNGGVNESSNGVTTDFAGTIRPQGTAYDIGAWEVLVLGNPRNGDFFFAGP